MPAEEIRIYSRGSTHTVYASCGDYRCTMSLLRAVGVSEREAASPEDVNKVPVDGAEVTCGRLKESDSCEFCAACGEFIRHGIRYPGEGGCAHSLDDQGIVIDPKPLDGPHADLRNAPALVDYL